MASKPRIAVVSPFVDRQHGTERCLAEQLERLASGFEIDLFSERVEDIDLTRIRWHRVLPIPAPQIFAYAWWFSANSIARWWARRIRGQKPALLYSPGINCFGADVIWVHIVFEQFLRNRGTTEQAVSNRSPSLALSIHRRMYYQLIRLLERRIYRKRDNLLVVPSKRVAAAMESCFGRSERVEVVYHGCDVKRFRPQARCELRSTARAELGFGESDLVTLLIGNDWTNKGLPVLVDAVSRCPNPSLRILAVGKDDPAPCLEFAKQRNLSGRLVFKPVRPDVEFYYAAADVYAGPSREDAFALPPLEAMACGLPAITSRNAGVSELIQHGVDGFVLEDPSDAATLSDLLARLAADADFRRRIGDAAAVTASKHTWENNASRLNEIFERVLLERSAS